MSNSQLATALYHIIHSIMACDVNRFLFLSHIFLFPQNTSSTLNSSQYRIFIHSNTFKSTLFLWFYTEIYVNKRLHFFLVVCVRENVFTTIYTKCVYSIRMNSEGVHLYQKHTENFSSNSLPITFFIFFSCCQCAFPIHFILWFLFFCLLSDRAFTSPPSFPVIYEWKIACIDECQCSKTLKTFKRKNERKTTIKNTVWWTGWTITFKKVWLNVYIHVYGSELTS